MSLFCGIFICSAQNISDTVFMNVIKIEDKNITKLGTRMLIDVSIPSDIKVPIVFFNTSVTNEIPQDLLFKLYLDYDYIMFIVPDWNVSKTLTIYKLDRGRRNGTGKKSVDSLNIQENFPKLQFADMTLKDGEIDIYFATGCNLFIYECSKSKREFLKKNIDKIGDAYKLVHGYEGEHTIYCTLVGTAEEKLNFLVGGFLEATPYIYTPFRLNITKVDRFNP